MFSFILWTLVFAPPVHEGGKKNPPAHEFHKSSTLSTSLKPSTSLNITNLDADARLLATLTLQSKSQAISDCLQTVREQTGLNLRATDDIGQRRITVFAAHVTLHNWMQAVADTTGLSWRTAKASSQINAAAGKTDTNAVVSTDKSFDGYELYLGEAQRNKEQAQTEVSEKRSKWSLNTQRERLMALARDAKGPFAGMLAQLSPEQLAQACELAAHPIGPISSSNNSHYFDHLTNVRPFADLPPDVQANVRQMLSRPETMGSGPNAIPLAPALQKADDLSQSYIGIVAADGGLSLGVIAPDGKDVWVSRNHEVHRSGIAGIDSDDDSNPEVTEQMAQVNLLDLEGVPKAIRHKKLHFPNGFDRASLPELLQVLAQQTGLVIVADDFARSRRTVYFQLLTDKMEYTLGEACEQIAKAYGHSMVYKEGVLRVKTVSLGLDLRTEPSADALARLRELTTKKLSATLADYQLLGRLSRLQLDTLVTAHFPGISEGGLLLSAQRSYDALHFYALLPPALRDKAETAQGLTIRDLNARQLEGFTALGGIGMPHITLAQAKTPSVTLRPGLYVAKQEANGKLQRLTLTVASDARPAVVTEYRLVK